MREQDFIPIGLRARVCIGMPVHNGERFIAQAIKSILAQNFGDFELLISDNASTDHTADICREYAARDPRISFTRLSSNIGAINNYNRVYQFGGGQYFKWAACDDVIEPTFIQRCVDALDNDPSAVLAHPRTRFIDADGQAIGEYTVQLDTAATLPHTRFAALAMAKHKETYNFEIFGLMRRSSMDLIPPQGAYCASDRVFLARLALHGRFIEIPEVLFMSRSHPGQSIHTLPRYLQERRTWVSQILGHGQLPPTEWFDPKYASRITFPEWRLMWEYLTSVRYGWLNARERTACMTTVFRRQLSHGNWARMVRDFVLAADKMTARISRGNVQRPAQAKPASPAKRSPSAKAAA